MDYQFTKDIDRTPVAKCSMEHEAFGEWLTVDIKDQKAVIEQIISQANSLARNPGLNWQLTTDHYHLTLTSEDAILRASHLFNSTDSFGDFDNSFSSQAHDEYQGDTLFGDAGFEEDELSTDDQHGSAMCGLEDFQDLVEGWKDFIESLWTYG